MSGKGVATRKRIDFDYMRCCERCRKKFYTLNPMEYRYKRSVNNRILFFCSWSCMRAWERESSKVSKTKRGKEYYEVHHFE